MAKVRGCHNGKWGCRHSKAQRAVKTNASSGIYEIETPGGCCKCKTSYHVSNALEVWSVEERVLIRINCSITYPLISRVKCKNAWKWPLLCCTSKHMVRPSHKHAVMKPRGAFIFGKQTIFLWVKQSLVYIKSDTFSNWWCVNGWDPRKASLSECLAGGGQVAQQVKHCITDAKVMGLNHKEKAWV